jgi:hypothetical protein
MSTDAPTSFGRVLLIGLLIVATLGFGLASLCGAAFTVMTLPDMFSSRVENYSGAFLIISVPSLLIGGGLAWWCGYRLAKRWRNDA